MRKGGRRKNGLRCAVRGVREGGRHTREAVHAKHARNALAKHMPTCNSTPGKTVFCHLKHCVRNAISLSSFKLG